VVDRLLLWLKGGAEALATYVGVGGYAGNASSATCYSGCVWSSADRRIRWNSQARVESCDDGVTHRVCAGPEEEVTIPTKDSGGAGTRPVVLALAIALAWR